MSDDGKGVLMWKREAEYPVMVNSEGEDVMPIRRYVWDEEADHLDISV